MIGLAGIGAALVLGIGTRAAAVAGAILLVLMWTAVLPPDNNPFMDDHLIYALVLGVLAVFGAGRSFGLGGWWERTTLSLVGGVLLTVVGAGAGERDGDAAAAVAGGIGRCAGGRRGGWDGRVARSSWQR